MKTKQELRREVREKKKNMTVAEITEKSQSIFASLEQMDMWKQEAVIYAYVSYNQEVDTRNRLANWLQQGKQVAVPKVHGEEMSFYFVDSVEQLQEGYQHILEPVTEQCADGHPGLMLMPGLAFDRQFHRLGYGGGFYDRYLERYSDRISKKIALAYEFQTYEEIPFASYDAAVDMIITEQNCYDRKNEE